MSEALRPSTVSTLNGERVFILGIAVEDSNRGPREVIDYIDGDGNGRWVWLDQVEVAPVADALSRRVA